jgi:hypothetical protein
LLYTTEKIVTYSDVLLHIDGKWRGSSSGRSIRVFDPATEDAIGTVAHADKTDLDEALAAASRGFKTWRAVTPFDRAKVMRKAAALVRERSETIAWLLVKEQGKTLVEALAETATSADIIEWFAEEGRRTYGRLIPSRTQDLYQKRAACGSLFSECAHGSPRAAHHIAGPIHFFAQLFQHMRGLSPTSQFSPSGGAGGNAPTRGAEMPTRPSI